MGLIEMLEQHKVNVSTCNDYEMSSIFSAMPEELFALIKPGDSVILKPNWVMESHKTRKETQNCSSK